MYQRLQPAFGEEVGMWRSHDKKQAKSAHNKGAVGRFIAIQRAPTSQAPELVYGLQPKTVAVECLRLSKPRIVPDRWSKDAVQTLASHWQTVQTSEGKDPWLRMDTDTTFFAISYGGKE